MHPACRRASRRHACRDIAPTLRLGEHLGARPPSAGAGGWTRAYAAHLLVTLERQLIAPLCLSAETDLRLSNHASQALRGDKAEKPQAKVVREQMRPTVFSTFMSHCPQSQIRTIFQARP